MEMVLFILWFVLAACVSYIAVLAQRMAGVP